jgi:regulator of RNase E activity RraA
MVDYTDTTSPRPSTHYIDAAPPGSVILIKTPATARSACWGGLMSTSAQAQGLEGVVVLGRVRDLAEHRSLAFPVFARGHSTLGQTPFTRPAILGQSLSVDVPHLEGGQPFIVHPTDLILADEDGVLAIPSALVEQVIEGAAERRRIDELCAQDLREGKGVKETFKARRGG